MSNTTDGPDLKPSRSYVAKTNTPDGARYAQLKFLSWVDNLLYNRQTPHKELNFSYLTRNPSVAIELLDNVVPRDDNHAEHSAAFEGITNLYHISGSVDSKFDRNSIKGSAFKPRKVAALSALNPTHMVQELNASSPRHTLIGPGVVELMYSGIGMNTTTRVLGELADRATVSGKVMCVVLNPGAFQAHEAEMLVTAPQLEPVTL
ncbi:MAG: hypothetical protein HY362_00455 [Candidatus Aenigmarchaeota archaeon]|nr:hypothetical protein [Candidatus Aenigmarchaeota archaeon]